MAQKLRILIVEDHAYSAANIAQAFAKQDFECLLHLSRDDASVALTGFRPDVIVMEYEMPGMSAEDFITQSKRECPRATMLLIGEKTDDQLSTLPVKPDAVFHRPLSLDALIQYVKNIAR